MSPVLEQHFQNGWHDKTIINVSRYVKKGLDLNYHFEIRKTGTVPTAEDVEKARLEAFKQEKKCERVVITYLDADVIPENSRNAPMDGKLPNCPKKRCSLDGDTFYDWKPLTQKNRYDYQKRAE